MIDEQLRDPRRRSLARARAIHDDLAIPGQLREVPGHIVHRHVNCAGYPARLESPRRVRAHVDDDGLVARFNELVEIGSADPRHAQLLVEAPPIPPLVEYISHERRGDHGAGDAADTVQVYEGQLNLCLEEHTGGQPAADPDGTAERAQSQESRPADAYGTRERRRNDGKTGHELGDHQRIDPPALEARLGLVDARVGLEGDTAQRFQHAHAVAPSDQEPDAVGHDAGEHRRREQGREAKRAGGGDGPGQYQRRHGRNRQADLIHEYVDEHDGQSVQV